MNVLTSKFEATSMFAFCITESAPQGLMPSLDIIENMLWMCRMVGNHKTQVWLIGRSHQCMRQPQEPLLCITLRLKPEGYPPRVLTSSISRGELGVHNSSA